MKELPALDGLSNAEKDALIQGLWSTGTMVQLQQITEQLHQIQEVVAQLSDRSHATQPDPQIYAALQPLHTHLQ